MAEITEQSAARSRMFGLTAINYHRARVALDNRDIPGFGAAFSEVRRIQEEMSAESMEDWSPEDRKSVRVMAETLQICANRGSIPFVYSELSDQARPLCIGAGQPVEVAPDVLAALGRYAYCVPFCMIQSSLLGFDIERGQGFGADRAYGFYWELSEARDAEAPLIAILDGAQVPDSDPAFAAYEFLREQVKLMERDVAAKCAAAAITPQRMDLSGDEPATERPRGLSVDCGTREMGELMVAYGSGLSYIEGRRRRIAPYMEGASAVIDLAYEVGPLGSYIGGYKDILPCGRRDVNIDDGDLRLAPSRVAHALRLEILRRGEKKFKQDARDLIMSPRKRRDMGDRGAGYRERIARFGLLAAEYAGFLLSANDLQWSIWPERVRTQMRGRRHSAEKLLHAIMASLDADQTPDADPMVVATDYIMRDIRRVEKAALAERDKLTRRVRRRSRRRAA